MEREQTDGRQAVTVMVPEALQMRLRNIHQPWEWLNDPEFWEGVLETGVAAREREQQELVEMLLLLESCYEK